MELGGCPSTTLRFARDDKNDVIAASATAIAATATAIAATATAIAATATAIDTVGAEHLLLGTDDPMIDSDLTHVQRLNLSMPEEDLILGGNAARLLGI